ncbi:regulatory-associated protein of hypothetical protein [Limosa lapponica baueri]|uniref:Uncharacterized protein n=1 Tax=Limosa lapponica baueri TaxID=1758121 RepID=A0A2I0T420_LIMLA|nr:regulatory-associated protein of hypothetical protein [Limosa lapponica baueri]
MGVENRNPPEQLPIVLQALSVGIFPYVLKLLQSSARELRPLLVFIWAKILAVDSVSTVSLALSLGFQLRLLHPVALEFETFSWGTSERRCVVWRPAYYLINLFHLHKRQFWNSVNGQPPIRC